MRSVVVDGSGRVSVEQRPDPVLPGPGGAIVEVTATAICGSDLHFLEGHYPVTEPVALGHEAIGVVVETGPAVESFSAGDRVLVSSVAGCGRCAGCRTKDPVTCVRGPQIFGSGLLGGAQSDLLAVPDADFQLLAMPDGVTVEQALLLTDNLATDGPAPNAPTSRSAGRWRSSERVRSVSARCAAATLWVPHAFSWSTRSPGDAGRRPWQVGTPSPLLARTPCSRPPTGSARTA
ncbi:hypothetical protein GCM10009645_44720 [Mycolicibacterium poriferae]|uniref:Alcohol dehydrogenase-like N-terminal domain-containing protein n=1 Tax=Mycolicibacterium poriferae TaxID=39694 RepID=A0A6N4V637_9MYCO|nr:hypothetical protein MPOR_21680 [Mycolicibacterium poriferae]